MADDDAPPGEVPPSGSPGPVERLLGVRTGEGHRTALLFAYLFCGSAVFILGRTVRDTLFLSRYSLAALPWMFVLFGVVSALVALFYAYVSDRLGRRLQMQAALAVGAVSYLGVWGLVRGGVSWIYPVFYIWTEVVANLLIMQFWTLANDLHDPRAAKRLFGTIGSARILGVIVCGLTAGLAVKALGTAQLLLVMTGLLAAMAFLAQLLNRYPAAVVHGGRGGGRPESLARVLKHPYVRTLTAVILLIFVALTVGDYQFKMIARANFTEDALARFFSLFYAAAGTVGFLIQLFVTPRLLRRFGVLAAMLAMPLCFGGSAGILLFTGSLAAACLMKFSDNGLQFTVHETVMQVLYVPFAPGVKAKTRAFLDTAVKPLSYGLGGLALVLLAHFHVPVVKMALLSLPVAVVWVALLPRVRHLYLRSLEASIAGMAASFEVDQEFVLDSESRKVLLRALESKDPVRVLHALERLKEEDGPELRAAFQRLCTHPDSRVREQALLRLGLLGDPECAGVVEKALSDPDAAVCAAAVNAYCALLKDEAIEEVAPLLEHEERGVRVEAAAGLVRHGGVEGAVLGGGRLESLLKDPRTGSRMEAADILKRLGPAGYRPLKRLLEDPEAKVRGAALKAAASAADPRLVPLLLEALATEKGRKRAARALAAVGPAAIPPLVELLKDEEAPRILRLTAPRIVRAIRDIRAYEELRALPAPADGQVRLRVWAAFGGLRQDLGQPPLPMGEVLPRVEAELRQAYHWSASWQLAREPYGTPLLADFLALRMRRAGRRVLRLLEQRYDRREVGLIMRNLADRRDRATALEVLDTLLEPALKRRIVPYFEEASPERLSEAAGDLATPPDAPVTFLKGLCRDTNPYAAFVGFQAAAQHGETAVLALAEARLDDPQPLVREGALLALGRLGGAEGLEKVRRRVDDSDPAVARCAAALLSGAEGTMYSTVEKILFVMSVPIFERLPGEDLAPLARAAEVQSFKPGEKVFQEGEMGDALYVVMRGKVAIRRGETLLAEMGPKEAFGEMAVLEAQPRSADAVALVDTELLRIGSEEFYEILREQVEIAEGILKVLVHRLRVADERLKELGAPPAPEKAPG